MATQEIKQVHVNNRLGGKATIVCSPSDTIGEFKKLIAYQLGLNSEDVNLQRQGQRPFKNDLTLSDYEIGDGSPVDLEMDTSD